MMTIMKSSNRHQILSSLFFIFCTTSALSRSSLAADTLTRGQSLRDAQPPQALLSSTGIFELGFFSPGNSTHRYVGIWYHNISTQSVVWVANRGAPLTAPGGSLAFGSDGRLALLTDDQGITLWSADYNTTDIDSNSSVIAQILDSGEFVIRSAGSSFPLWSSFDHPTDSFVQGMKVSLDLKTGTRTVLRSWKSPNDPSAGKYSFGLDPSGSGQVFIWEGRRPRWRSGLWDGTQFIGLTKGPALYVYGTKVFNDGQGYMYVTYTQYNTTLVRFNLQWDGVVNASMLVEETKAWMSAWMSAVNECQTYGKCLDYGICSPDGSSICSCLQGFEPRFSEEWSRGNWSGGCVRRTALQCELSNGTTTSNASRGNGEGDGFYVLQEVKVPDLAEWASMVLNEVDCQNACRNNCSCKAYSYVSGIGCLVWGSDLIDIYQFPEGSGSGIDLYIKVAGSELPVAAGHKSKIWLTIVILCASVTCLLVICGALLRWKFNGGINGWSKKDGKQSSIESSFKLIRDVRLDFSGPTEFGDGQEVKDAELPLLSFDVIASATSNFSDSNKLGKGGFGDVYKGKLPGGREVAVKRLSRSSGQGQEEFKNEVTLIARLQHRNLVRVVGCCIQEEEKILIYEYMPNKSLDAFIFDRTRQQQLNWNTRFSIIEGIARGLVYLHRDSRLRIVHRDLKASNILLDKDMNPKISDFGMARIFRSDQNQLNTARVVGTFGYMSPEYAMEGIFSVKSDVYSFGILVLEIVSGRRNNSFHNMPDTINILGYVWKLWESDRATEMIEPTILETCSVSQVVRCIQVGLLCVQDHASDRPDMHSVVLMLGSENAMLPMPRAPPFTMEGSQAMANRNEPYSENDVTITEFLGR